MMKRRDFIKVTGTGLATLNLSCQLAGTPGGGRRPNIVFVFADQLRAQEVGCYGGRQAPTPNIDRLAREGVRFTNAISTYPVCSPYRAMLLTGLYPMHNGMYFNDLPMKPGLTGFGDVCRGAGYRTAYIGKWHIDGRGREAYIPPERRLGFEHWMVLECTHEYFKSRYYADDSDQVRVWEGYDAVAQTRAAQEYIRAQAGQGPFALFLSWGPPHSPYIAPPSYMDRFSADRVQLRPNATERAVADDLFAQQRVRLPEKYLHWRRLMRDFLESDAALRKALAGYLAATAALDDCIGDLLRTLEEQGILDETIFVFTSDHGDMVGSHRLFEKEWPHEESILIPFVTRYPARIPAGTVSDALLAPIDVMPTVLALAGVPCPRVDGLDQSDAATGRGGGGRDALLLMHLATVGNAWFANGLDAWRGMRTKTHTYARFEDGTPWVFYDNEADPYQMRNLAADPASEALRRRLDARLDELLKEADDPQNQRIVHELILKAKPDYPLVSDLQAANPGR
ncbi:MAG: sulfatase [bacterium]|nr:sulfatase [bacterium]